MLRSIGDYIDIVGAETISKIFKKANKLYGKRVANVNATFLGGGVAEILGKMVPLMNEIGLDAEWRTIHGSPAFFDITKNFHNAMQGGTIELTDHVKSHYMDINQEYAGFAHLNSYDCVVVHDPQPLPLIKFYRKQQPWIWRCHIDITNPNKELWDFLKKFMIRYDMIIISSEKYKTVCPLSTKFLAQFIAHTEVYPALLELRNELSKPKKRWLSRSWDLTKKTPGLAVSYASLNLEKAIPDTITALGEWLVAGFSEDKPRSSFYYLLKLEEIGKKKN